MTDRVRWFTTNNPRIRVFALTCEVKPLGMADRTYTEAVDIDRRPPCHPSMLDDRISENFVIPFVNDLFGVQGIVEVSVRRHEIGIKIGSAFDWLDVAGPVKKILLDRFFRGKTDVAFESGSSSPRTQDEKDALSRPWGAVRLTTGFYMSELVRSVLQFADTEERRTAIQTVCDLLDDGCADEQKWRSAIQKLGGLCQAHPDAYKESGTWYDGDSCILALATAKETARAAMYKLYPTLHSDGEIEGVVYKAFKYLLRAMAQKAETAATCLKWVERELDLMPSRR